MDAVIPVLPEAPSQTGATPARRPLPVLDMDEVCRELAEALAHIEVLPFLYPDEITPGSST
ncbi:hypothetical protein [Streptomyces sp. NPDC006551]|uniref:hypothetical protein n=1 Tax=Streptomyces sp. NPDC006551 TaxID=3157178 RepID=UPI0033BF9113